MQIYDALKSDHANIKSLMERLVSLSENDHDEKTRILEEVRDELVPHARAEEAVFYNSMRLLDETKSLAMHGYREHIEAETLLRTLQAEDVVNANWKGTAYKLKEALEHHIMEEETEMFTQAMQLFTAEEAEAIGQAFERMKPEVREEGFMKNTLDMIKNMMPPRLTGALNDFHWPVPGAKGDPSTGSKRY